MLLIQRELGGAAFAIQFGQIIGEFGGVIPWLEPVHTIGYATNRIWFRDQFLRGLRCQDPDDVTPFQFVTSDRSREYVGGMIHFRHSPEAFRSRENRGIAEQLTAEGFQFISCLQVRDTHRGVGHGRALMRRALRVVLERYGCVWGVTSDWRTHQWHISLGARSWSSPLTNHEGLGIVSWENATLVA